MAKKKCPPICPVCGQGDLAGGGPLACRYTCGHVISRASAEMPKPPDISKQTEKSTKGSKPFSKGELGRGYRKL